MVFDWIFSTDGGHGIPHFVHTHDISVRKDVLVHSSWVAHNPSDILANVREIGKSEPLVPIANYSMIDVD